MKKNKKQDLSFISAYMHERKTFGTATAYEQVFRNKKKYNRKIMKIRDKKLTEEF